MIMGKNQKITKRNEKDIHFMILDSITNFAKELKKRIRKLKIGKSPGHDKITSAKLC